jgi:hypothetical protein
MFVPLPGFLLLFTNTHTHTHGYTRTCTHTVSVFSSWHLKILQDSVLINVVLLFHKDGLLFYVLFKSLVFLPHISSNLYAYSVYLLSQNRMTFLWGRKPSLLCLPFILCSLSYKVLSYCGCSKIYEHIFSILILTLLICSSGRKLPLTWELGMF